MAGKENHAKPDKYRAEDPSLGIPLHDKAAKTDGYPIDIMRSLRSLRRWKHERLKHTLQGGSVRARFSCGAPTHSDPMDQQEQETGRAEGVAAPRVLVSASDELLGQDLIHVYAINEQEKDLNIGSFVLCISGISFLLCGNAFSQNLIEKAATDPFEKQLLIEFDNGTIAIADDNTQRIYISTSSGQEYDVSFVDAIAASEPDLTKRQQTLLEFRASLKDTGHMVAVRSLRTATDATLWPRLGPPVEWCGNVICIESSSSGDRALEAQGTSYFLGACNHYLCPELPWPCDLGPCSPNKWGDGMLTFYSSHGAGWGATEGGGTVSQQQLIEYDKGRFESVRQGACSEKNLVATATAATGVAAGSACLLIATGAGAAACAAGIVSYGIGLYQTNKKAKECHATYPGIGNW